MNLSCSPHEFASTETGAGVYLWTVAIVVGMFANAPFGVVSLTSVDRLLASVHDPVDSRNLSPGPEKAVGLVGSGKGTKRLCLTWRWASTLNFNFRSRAPVWTQGDQGLAVPSPP